MDDLNKEPNEERTLDDLLKDLIGLKITGNPCSVKEARVFYYDVWKTVKEDYCRV